MLRRPGFNTAADNAMLAAKAPIATVRNFEMEREKPRRGVCSRSLTRFSKPEGGLALPRRSRVWSISEFVLMANFLPAPARLQARVAHGTTGSGWWIQSF